MGKNKHIKDLEGTSKSVYMRITDMRNRKMALDYGESAHIRKTKKAREDYESDLDTLKNKLQKMRRAVNSIYNYDEEAIHDFEYVIVEIDKTINLIFDHLDMIGDMTKEEINHNGIVEKSVSDVLFTLNSHIPDAEIKTE